MFSVSFESMNVMRCFCVFWVNERSHSSCSKFVKVLESYSGW